MPRDANKIWEAWGRTNALYTAWCADRGQNPYQLFVLYAINAHEPVTQKKIADYTGLSKQTVSTIMRSLKAKNYAVLRAGGTDRREKSVQLTQEGKNFVKEVLTPLYELETRIFNIIGAERMKRMSDAIALFNTVFEKEMENQRDELAKK